MDNIIRVTKHTEMIMPCTGWKFAYVIECIADDGTRTYEIEARALVGWALVKEADHDDEYVGIGCYDPTFINMQTIPTLIDHFANNFLGYIPPGENIDQKVAEEVIERLKAERANK